MASSSSQFDYIRERLNDTDIYVLLLGGRYGILTPGEDRSYTHEEYEMAKANPDVRVLPFVCNHPENRPVERRWQDDDEHDKLMRFTEEAESSKMVGLWNVDTSPENMLKTNISSGMAVSACSVGLRTAGLWPLRNNRRRSSHASPS